MIYDLVIVGGGPAGMSAALYAARQNLKFIVITKDIGGLANFVPDLKTYLGYSYTTGFELVEKFKEHLGHYKIQTKLAGVKDIRKAGNIFAVRTDKGGYKSKTIIVATGRRFKKLGIKGEKQYAGKGVSDCTVCDGPLFKGKTVAVIGGGRTGIFATLFILEIAKEIYLIEKSPCLKTEGGLRKFEEIIAKNKKVKIITNAVPVEIKGNGFVKQLVISTGGKKSALPIDAVFVEIGYEPNTDFIKIAKKNGRGEIIVDEECNTSVKGLFAAGDVTSLREKQVIVSVGEGAKAVLSAVLFLEKNKGKC